nr:PREDICTED: venom carboxylesterase-6-like [Bemisia tabaci]
MEIEAWTKWTLLVIAVGVCFCENIEVSTPKGKIIGSDRLRTIFGDRIIYSFTNIPYAKPPVGIMRFQEPEELDSWDDPINATTKVPYCPQLVNDNAPYPQVMGTEDCLALNVYTPKVNKSAKLPVMIFFHGGNFDAGSSATYGPELMLDKDICLVTVNYRLGVLGFLTTCDEFIPANIGLKDQSLAIKWVHDNIEYFGGNPDLITVMGESAGAASTHLHLLSPLSKDYIQRGIIMSGTVDCPWGFMTRRLAVYRTKALAVLCGCPPNPSSELRECLQTVPLQQILDAARKFHEWILVPPIVYRPTIEKNGTKNFLPADPRTLESKIPILLGMTSGEGGLFAPKILNAGPEYENDLRTIPYYILPRLLLLREDFPKDKVRAVTDEIMEHHFGQKTIDYNQIGGIVELFTDRWFLHGTIATAENYKGEAYLYYYDYLHTDFRKTPVAKNRVEGTVSHADDLLDFFPILKNRTWTDEEIAVSKRNIDLWTYFAIHGKPNRTAFPEWDTADTKKYLHITGDGLTVEEDLLPERVNFWRSLYSNESSSQRES